jgi:hypothetical protein
VVDSRIRDVSVVDSIYSSRYIEDSDILVVERPESTGILERMGTIGNFREALFCKGKWEENAYNGKLAHPLGASPREAQRNTSGWMRFVYILNNPVINNSEICLLHCVLRS